MGYLKENRVLKSVAAYLGVHSGSEIDELIKKEEQILKDERCGLIWLIFYLTKKKRSSLLGQNSEEEVLVRQWLEYASVYLNNISVLNSNDLHSILKEISDVFSDKVFLLTNKLSIADILFYYMLHPIMDKISLHEKENYIHLSRWFNHIQQDRKIRQSNSLLVFSRTLLYH